MLGPTMLYFTSMQHSITLELWRTLVGSTWATEVCSCLGVTDHERSTQLSSTGYTQPNWALLIKSHSYSIAHRSKRHAADGGVLHSPREP